MLDLIIATKYHSLCSLPPASTPLILRLSLIDPTSGSTYTVKSNGKRGSPCQGSRLKKGDVVPFVRTAAYGAYYNTFTHSIQKPSKYTSNNPIPPCQMLSWHPTSKQLPGRDLFFTAKPHEMQQASKVVS